MGKGSMDIEVIQSKKNQQHVKIRSAHQQCNRDGCKNRHLGSLECRGAQYDRGQNEPDSISFVPVNKYTQHANCKKNRNKKIVICKISMKPESRDGNQQ